MHDGLQEYADHVVDQYVDPGRQPSSSVHWQLRSLVEHIRCLPADMRTQPWSVLFKLLALLHILLISCTA